MQWYNGKSLATRHGILFWYVQYRSIILICSHSSSAHLVWTKTCYLTLVWGFVEGQRLEHFPAKWTVRLPSCLWRVQMHVCIFLFTLSKLCCLLLIYCITNLHTIQYILTYCPVWEVSEYFIVVPEVIECEAEVSNGIRHQTNWPNRICTKQQKVTDRLGVYRWPW